VFKLNDRECLFRARSEFNGLIGKDDVMNAQTLAKVRRPNSDGFKP
jgi:hypothetical protein